LVRVVAGGDSSKAADSNRLVGIEGLRAIAAASILVYHVWLYGAPDGHSIDLGALTKVFANLRSGVTLFFALSGFLLFRPYVAAALRGRRSPALGAYLRNRALRILPAYWVILLFVAIVLERELLSRPEQLVANAFLVQDYVPGYIYGYGIVPAWSLAIEVVFYVAVPILGAVAIRLAMRRGTRPLAAAFAPVALMIAIGFAAKAALHVWPDLGRVWEVSFLTHADWFAAGMTVAILRVLWEDGRLRLPRFWAPTAGILAFLFAVIAVGLEANGTVTRLENQTLVAVSCGLVLALVVFSSPRSPGIRLLTWKPVFAAGLASYSVFLWHDPFVRELREAGVLLDGRSGFLVNLALIAALTAVLSALSYLFVEKPALARKRGWQRSAPAAPRAAPERAPEAELAPGQAIPAVTR
jgi:peptidoglycan/LPS O-acetylase OafA/YrhL